MNTVTFKRIGLLIKKDLLENRYSHLISMLVLFLVLLLLLSLDQNDIATPEMSLKTQHDTYIFLLVIFGIRYVYQFYRDIRSTPRNLFYLMLPASAGEKLVAGILASIPLFFIAFTLVFYLAAGLSVAIYDGYAKTLLPFSDLPWAGMALGLAFHGLFTWGAIKFERSAFFKTMTTALLVLFTIGLVNYYLIRFSYHNADILLSSNSITSFSFQQFAGIQFWVFVGFLTIYLWITAWFELKEKQV